LNFGGTFGFLAAFPDEDCGEDTAEEGGGNEASGAPRWTVKPV
jgi:hypothetical protein